MYIATAITLWVGLTIANFIWEVFMKRDWGKAIEKSFFQAVALGLYLPIIAARQ